MELLVLCDSKRSVVGETGLSLIHIDDEHATAVVNGHGQKLRIRRAASSLRPSRARRGTEREAHAVARGPLLSRDKLKPRLRKTNTEISQGAHCPQEQLAR